jgi:hypothetical protein
MGIDRSSRNLFLALAAVAAALGAGYLVGRDEARVPVAGPEVADAAAPVAGQPAAEPAAAEVEVEAPAAAPRAPEGPVPGSRRRVTSPPESPVTPPVAPVEVEPADEAVEPRVAARELLVPEGTTIQLRLADGVSSESAQVGDVVRAELAAPVTVGGELAIPAGATVIGHVTEAHALKKIGGRARLALAFEAVEVAGREVPIEAYFAREGRSETGKDAATIAAGAAIGTVLGNQSKRNDRGKVLGGLLGAGVGTAVAAST